MKFSIIYYSESGNTEKCASWVGRGAASVPNTEVRLFNLRLNADPDIDFVESSDAIVFGTPTYLANMCWLMKKWFDTKTHYNLGGKLGAVFATENSPNGGGGELAILTVAGHLLVKGMMVYSGGTSCGRPFIHIGPTIVRSCIDEKEHLCRLFGERIAQQAHRIFDCQEVKA